jgi:hypothetical protein
MEIALKLPGRYTSATRKNQFTQNDLDAIYNDFIAGMIQIDLYEKHNINRSILEYLVTNYYIKGSSAFAAAYTKFTIGILGYKDVAYASEEEMLKPKEYTWESLSKKERLFYERYTRKLERERYYARFSSND